MPDETATTKQAIINRQIHDTGSSILRRVYKERVARHDNED